MLLAAEGVEYTAVEDVAAVEVAGGGAKAVVVVLVREIHLFEGWMDSSLSAETSVSDYFSSTEIVFINRF